MSAYSQGKGFVHVPLVTSLDQITSCPNFLKFLQKATCLRNQSRTGDHILFHLNWELIRNVSFIQGSYVAKDSC